jgi:galactokinase
MNNELIEHITTVFKTTFKDEPVLVNSPGRINIIGEHTDYNEGFVFPAAIDKSIVAAFSKSHDDYCHALAIDKNETYSFKLDELKPIPNGNWRNYVVGVVAEITKLGKLVKPFNLVFGGDIPDGAGLSSSAALENSVVYGLNELYNLGLSKSEMILISQRAEHHFAGVKCGIMDQYASMFGVENHALLLDCRTLDSKRYEIDLDEFEIILINTNVKHNLVDAEYNDRREVCETVAQLLQINALRDADEDQLKDIKQKITHADYQKALYIIQENNRVLKAAKCIESNDIIGLGTILFEAHQGMKNQFKISCTELDFLVDSASKNKDVIGSRMMGGGFGGCTINIVHKKAIKSFTTEIAKAYAESFGFNCSIFHITLSNGTQIIK